MRTDPAKWDALTQMLLARLGDVLDEFGAKLRPCGGTWQGTCPVHPGDANAFVLYEEGHTAPGFWRCHTKHCEEVFGAGVLGLIRGLLSARDAGWCAPGDAVLSYSHAVRWACDFLGVKFADLKVDAGMMERARFSREFAGGFAAGQKQAKGLAREAFRDRLAVPSPYFVRRGFSPDVLDRLDVGDAPDGAGVLSGRAVVPVADEDGRVAGFSGRSVHEACSLCGFFHRPDGPCPTDEDGRRKAAKWRHSRGLHTGGMLYNWGFALKHVRASGVAVLVEGPADVWRLEEAGIRVSAAVFGNRMGDEQQVKLEASGAKAVVCLFDSDEAGRAGAEDLRRRLRRLFRLEFPELPAHDAGSMAAADLRSFLLPVLKRAQS